MGKQSSNLRFSIWAQSLASEKNPETAVFALDYLELSILVDFFEEMIPIEIVDLAAVRQFEEPTDPAMKAINGEYTPDSLQSHA